MILTSRTQDNYKEKLLKGYHLPIIRNVEELVSLLCISDSQEKLFFYSQNRKYIYKVKYIPKRNGSYRKIEKPISQIKEIQNAINNVILSKFYMSENAMAYLKGKSIKTNALQHLGARIIIKFDIKDFFSSIGYGLIRRQLMYFGYGRNVSSYLSLLLTNSELKLPQGAPTSPSISNLVFIEIDKRINNYCKRYGLVYTRYADDITISSKMYLQKNVIGKIKSFIKFILEKFQFELNEDKYGVYSNNCRLVVTGITVNSKLSIREKEREVENAIRYIGKYGLNNHLEHINCTKSNYIPHIFGLISFINMLDRSKGAKYQKAFEEVIKNVR